MRIIAISKRLLPLLTLFICGCSAPFFATLDDTLLSPAYWNMSTTEQQARKSRVAVERALADGDLETARTTLLSARREKVPEPLLGDLYTGVTNQLLQTASQADAIGRSEQAGMFFRQALEVYPNDLQLQSIINLTREEVCANIEQCADSIMQDGLIAYRDGDLDKAIKIWQSISRFHPDYAPGQIASSTARQQLKSLETISSERAL